MTNLTFDNALFFVENLSRQYREGQGLSNLERAIFQGLWEGLRFKDIAKTYPGAGLDHIQRNAAPKLYRFLSKATGEKVKAHTLKSVINQAYFHDNLLPSAEVLTRDIRAKMKEYIPVIDWGEAPEIQGFVGRTTEVEQLQHWIIRDRCRLVAILGLGGIGKTGLAVELINRLKTAPQQPFQLVFWRSLRDAPELETIVTDLLEFIARETNISVNTTPELKQKINQLIKVLAEVPCLVVLDNLESIFRPKDNQVGTYLNGYENYGEFLQRVREGRHQSCLLITSREKPSEIETSNLCQALPIKGLQAEAEAILAQKGLSGTTQQKQDLITKYDGNPLALIIASELIKEVYQGKIQEFLNVDRLITGKIEDLLNQQYQRLSELEKPVMYWLAINRKPVSLPQLQQDIYPSPDYKQLRDAVQSLIQRSLIETTDKGHTLQNVIMEYMTDKLREAVCEEIKVSQLNENSKLNRYALLKASAEDYIRRTQKRLIINPIMDNLNSILSKKLVAHFQQMIPQIESQELEGYAAGNLINLLCNSHRAANLANWDFSGLTIRQAFFRDVELPGVNLEKTKLHQCIFPLSMGEVWHGVFYRDSKLVVGDNLGTLYILDIETHQTIKILSGHSSNITSLRVNQKTETIISVSRDRTIRFWDFNTGRCQRTVQFQTDAITVSTISPDEKILATNHLNSPDIEIWDLNTGQHIRTLSGHQASVTGIAFSPTNPQLLVTGSKDTNIIIWNLETGQLIATLTGHYRETESGGLAFSKDGNILVTGSNDSTIKFWDISNLSKIKELHCISDGHQNDVRGLAFSPDRQLLASGDGDRLVKLWDISEITNPKLINTLRGHSSWLNLVRFSENGNYLLTAAADKIVCLWDVETPKKPVHVETWRGYSNWIRSVAFSPDGKTLISGSDDYTVRIWDVATKQLKDTWRGHQQRVMTVAVHPDGKILASGSWDYTVRLWNLQTGEWDETDVKDKHTDQVYGVAFTPDRKFLVSVGDDHTVRVWNVATKSLAKKWHPQLEQLFAVAVSLDSQMIAVGGHKHGIKLWNLYTYEEKSLTKIDRETTGLAFSPDGKKLASSSFDRTVQLWDLATGKELRKWLCSQVWTYGVAFSPNGELIASGSEDYSLCLWDVNSGECRHKLLGHQKSVTTVAFSPDGEIVASGSVDETIKLWDVKTGKCLATLEIPRPFAGSKVTGIQGETEAETEVIKATLIALGASEA